MQKGWARCYNADIVVVDNLTPLLAPDAEPYAARSMSVADALLIVGFGRIVASSSCWARVKSNPNELTVNDVVGHEPMALKVAVKMVFSTTLRGMQPHAYSAAKQCCRAIKSKWTMRQALTAAACKDGEVWFGEEGDIWKFLCRIRQVRTFRGAKVARHSSGVNALC